jgi:putative SOS response-associated peptidase YedK
MCGRYSLAVPPTELVEVFDVPALTFDYAPRYNIAPGQDAPVVATDRRGRRIGPLRWGLVPAWVETPGGGFINARGESVTTTPSFRDAFVSRRCLVPADGFYEWRKDGGGKTPFWFHAAAGGVLALAGIWERWAAAGHEPRYGFAVLTVEANPDVAGVHDRMPVLLDPSSWDVWLDQDAPLERVEALVVPAAAGTLLSHAVSTRVNHTDNDDAGLVEPV